LKGVTEKSSLRALLVKRKGDGGGLSPGWGRPSSNLQGVISVGMMQRALGLRRDKKGGKGGMEPSK